MDCRIITIDTLKIDCIILKNKLPFYFADKFDSSEFDYSNTNEYFSDDKTGQLAKKVALMMFALKYSSTPFYVYFFPDECYSDDLIGFFKDGEVFFINTDFHIFTALQEIIEYRYGSVAKYYEMVESDMLKNQFLLKLDFATAVNILRRDYITYENSFPKDTTKILSLFFAEIDSLVHLTDTQKNLLVTQITKRLRSMKINLCGLNDVCILHEPVNYQIDQVLTIDQYHTYLDKLEFVRWAQNKASLVISRYLLKERKLPLSKMPSAFNKVLFP
jgi:hypothetical protein